MLLLLIFFRIRGKEYQKARAAIEALPDDGVIDKKAALEQLKNIQGQGGKNLPFSDYLMRYKTKIFSRGHFVQRDERENV